MALRGSLCVEVDVKSAADKFWGILSDPVFQFPKVLPDYYKSISLLEGTAMAPGAVVLVIYGKGFPVKDAKERIEAVDEANRSFTYSVIGGMEKYYKTLKGTFSVVPKGEGSVVTFSCVFEKTSKEIADPIDVKEFKVKNLEGIDAYLLKD